MFVASVFTQYFLKAPFFKKKVLLKLFNCFNNLRTIVNYFEQRHDSSLILCHRIHQIYYQRMKTSLDGPKMIVTFYKWKQL